MSCSRAATPGGHQAQGRAGSSGSNLHVLPWCHMESHYRVQAIGSQGRGNIEVLVLPALRIS